MQINVRLFAILKEKAGRSSLALELPADSTAADALMRIGQRIPEIAVLLPRIALAVNEQYAKPDAALCEGDELALIPPVSGGTDQDWTEISAGPLSTTAAIEFVTCNEAGGIDLFLGTTRAEISADGKALLALDYEAHESMARRQLKELAAAARARFPVCKIAVLHRVGRVKLGEPSVVIAVSAAHRAEAFDACRFLIDQLKLIATIWKQEVWDDHSRSWVHPGL